jgi:hypothetical protein
MSTPFKMSGMTFKEGQAPMKFINFKNLAKKVGAKGENVASKVLDKIGDTQEKFVAWKKKHGLNTDKYDASVKDEDGKAITVEEQPVTQTPEEMESIDPKSEVTVSGSASLPVAPGLPGTPKI